MRAARRFEALIDGHHAMVARICASYERDPELARELAQEVWLAVWRSLPSFRGDASVRTFVARIAQFRAASHVGARLRLPPGAELDPALPAPGPLPDTQAIAADRRERLLEAVRQLPIAYRDPVILTLEDFTPAEIAEVLGVTANVVSIRLTRARALLRTWLREAP